MKYRLEVINQSHKIELVKDERGKIIEIFVDDQQFLVSDLENLNNITFENHNETIYFNFNEEKFDIKLKEINSDEIGNNSTKTNNLDQLLEFFKSGFLISPMPGKIVDIQCTPGQIVNKGKLLLSLEAMKMENEILAPFQMKIKKIMVSVSDTVTDKQKLLEFEEIVE